MNTLNISLAITTILCCLVTGFVLAFAIVVMPGISKLSDKRYLESFKVMDKIIQDNQPLFMIVWVGSVLSVIVSAVLGFLYAGTMGLLVIVIGASVYILGVQVPTMVFNVPLNNRLQEMDLEESPDEEVKAFRAEFERVWIRWNSIRTVNGLLATILFLYGAIVS